ncbi:DUF262 domain-containing protein [Variovorax sp. RCC_210]|uniref:GmrSD restriction endonuclease domain-containing protein n=1 Tax=Variovorax sp. RCC_210 TaxID=3239217 RepID=UPI0035268D66
MSLERRRRVSPNRISATRPSCSKYFVATNSDGSWELVDGLQRISTVLHFVLEQENSDDLVILKEMKKETSLSLLDLAKLSSFNGLRFVNLPQSLQFLFLKRQFRVTALSDKSDHLARFDLFERLNRGGIALSPQEVRDCVYRGPFSNLISDLSLNSDFLQLIKVQKLHKDDGTIEEQVLKFFAYLNWRENFDGSVTEFLNLYMEHRHKETKTSKDRAEFTATVKALQPHISGPMLRKNTKLTPLNQFEAILVGAAEVLRKNNVLQPQKGWLDDAQLTKFSTGGTNTRAMLKGRIQRASELLLGAPVE